MRKAGVSWGWPTPRGRWSRAHRPHFAGENTGSRMAWLPSGHTVGIFALCQVNWSLVEAGRCGGWLYCFDFLFKILNGLPELPHSPACQAPPTIKTRGSPDCGLLLPRAPWEGADFSTCRTCSRWASNVFYQKARKCIPGHKGLSKTLRSQFEKAPVGQSWGNLFK